MIACFIFLAILLNHVQSYPLNSRIRRMVNGQRADRSDWSFAVWIVKDQDGGFPRYCGGSLITTKWVLTAAHCVDSVQGKPWKLTVYIGSTDQVLMTSSNDFMYQVTHIAIHDGYAKLGDDGYAKLGDDLALLRLNRSVLLSGSSSILLPPIGTTMALLQSNYSCKAAGWGKYQEFASKKEMYSNATKPSRYLTEITVPLATIDACFSDKFDLLRNWTALTEKFVCGGIGNAEHGTACLHDSGSPFVCREADGVSYLHGVAIAINGPYISRRPCKPGKQTIVFMRLARYRGWLRKIIAQYTQKT